MLSVPPPNKVVPDSSSRNRALFEMMHKGVAPEGKQSGDQSIDYSSVNAMDASQKLQFLKRSDFNPFQLKDPYDFLNTQMYRWQQIARNVLAAGPKKPVQNAIQLGPGIVGKVVGMSTQEAKSAADLEKDGIPTPLDSGRNTSKAPPQPQVPLQGYSEDDKAKIADAAYERMIAPYYKATGQTPLSKKMWMREAYKSAINFDIDQRYKNPYSRGVLHGALGLAADFLRATDTFHNVIGAIVSPPKPITDESWQHSLLKTKDNTEPTGFWDKIQAMSDESGYTHFRNKHLPMLSSKVLNYSADKMQFLQDLRPNKGYVARASSMAVEAAPFVATNLAAPEVGIPEDIGFISGFIGKKLAGRVALGAMEAGRDGFIYGTLTRPYESKAKAYDDALAWSIGSSILHLGGAGFVAVGKKVLGLGDKGIEDALAQISRKGQLISANRRDARPEEIQEESEAAVAENIAKYGMIGQRAIDNSAAEHILKMESSGMTPEQIMSHERNLLVNGTDADRVMLDSVVRIRSTLGENKLSELSFEQKADTLARLQALAASASGKMTKHLDTLQSALKQRFTSLPPEKLDQNVQKYLLQQILPTLPKDANPQMIQKAVQEKWADLVVEAGKWSEEELMRDPFGDAKKAESARKLEKKQQAAASPVGTVSRTRRWSSKKGEPGVSFSISPAWKVYAKNELSKAGKEWNVDEIKNWVRDLSEDDFAADLHAFFMPDFLKEGDLYFEHGQVTGGLDHSNLYAFMYNFKNQMPTEYAERLEEEFMHSPKMSQFFDKLSKEEQPKLMRHIALGMWNHVDNFLGSGRFPKERNIFRSTQSDLRNPTTWQKDLFTEREEQEKKIIERMYKDGTPPSNAAKNVMKVLFQERRQAFAADEQAKMRLLSRGIADRIVDDSKGVYEDFGLKEVTAKVIKSGFSPSKDAPYVGQIRKDKNGNTTLWMNFDHVQTMFAASNPEDVLKGNVLGGIHLHSAESVDKLIHELQSFGDGFDIGSISYLLRLASRQAKNGAVQVIAVERPKSMGGTNIRDTFREEWTHHAQTSLNKGGDVHNMLAHLPMKDFMDLRFATPEGYMKHVAKYYSDSHPVIQTFEAVAKAIAHNPAKYGVSEEEAVKFLQLYFKKLEVFHGSNAPEVFKNAVGPARKLIRENYGKASSGKSTIGADAANPLASTK